MDKGGFIVSATIRSKEFYYAFRYQRGDYPDQCEVVTKTSRYNRCGRE